MSLKVYKSSAGSGKTFTLVNEYLKLALSSDNPKKYKTILAVTFTNKAANEMKERVVTYLTAIANNKYNSGAESLIKTKLIEFLKIPEETLQARANNTLKSILHEYSDFNISTIDKFILKIIRSFSIDFQIPMNFEIEMDSEAIIKNAVENVIASVGKNKENTRFLIEYINQQTEEDASWSIAEMLTKFAKNTLNENASFYLSNIKIFTFEDFLKAKKTCDDLNKSYQKRINDTLKKGKELYSAEGIVANDIVSKTKASVWSYFCKPANKFMLTETAPSYHQKFEQENWNHKDAKTVLSSTAQSQLYQLYQQIENIKLSELSLVLSASEISKHLFQLALINEIEKEILDLKRENNFIQISEFNQRVSEIVIQQPVPFIYERIGEKYTNYLIDEFQDTSELQWQNLMPLVENSLAYDNFNLVVGDVKQAIYRWRGGNVNQFQNIENPNYLSNSEIVNERLTNIRRYISSDTLATNYRSLPNIVKFNNLFFESLLEKLTVNFKDNFYIDYQQNIGSTKKGGYAEIILQNPDDKENLDDFNLQNCLNNITDCISRGYKYNDIAILTRKNDHTKLIGEYLVLNNIPILSSTSLSLDKSDELIFIMSIFKLVNNPEDYLSIVNITEFLSEKTELIDKQITVFANKKTALDSLKQFLLSEHNIQLPSIHNVGLYDAIESIIRLFKLDKNNPFIQKFLDVCNAYQETDNLEFINWWNDNKHKTYISSPESIDAVQLMTVHKSKGLEFPVVIFPFANKSKGAQKNLIWGQTKGLQLEIPYVLVRNVQSLKTSTLSNEFEQEQQSIILDDINTIYVCLTRASEELYIYGADVKDRTKKPIESETTYLYPVIEHLQEENGKFFYGEKNTKKTTPKTVISNDFTIENNSDWKSKIKLSFNAPTIWNVPITTEEAFISQDPRKHGNLIHSVFARITKTNELNSIINQMFEEGLIEKGILKDIEAEISQVLKLPFIQENWNTGKHLIEQELITKDGKSYRPDRIITQADKTLLIDFKTGVKSDKDKKQINNYAALLDEIGYQNISKHLIYLNPAEVITVEELQL